LNELIQAPGEVTHGCGRITWLTTEALATELQQRLPSPTIHWNAPGVDIVEQVGEKRRLLFVANPCYQEQHVTITFDTPRRLFRAWGGTALACGGAELTLDLAPYTIQIWEAQYD
jgi:hypothetical protein